MGKRVLFITGNYYPELTGIGKYTGEMVDWISSYGNDCLVVTTYPYYPTWQIDKKYRKTQWWFSKETLIGSQGTEIEVYRCPHFIPQNPSGSNRIFSEISMCASFIIIVFKILLFRRIESVVVAAPPFHLGALAILFKWFQGSKVLYHIYDLQIDAAINLKMLNSRIVSKILKKIEKFILNQSDVISTLTEGMKNKIERKCSNEVVLFPNWVDTKSFYPIRDKTFLKRKFKFSPNDKIIMYSGAIGEKQGLEIVLLIAGKLQATENIKFVICGSGPYKKKMMNDARQMNLRNVFFVDLQPIEELNDFLNLADIHLVLQKNEASDLVMPSKLTTIFAVGGAAIVSARKESSLFKLISNNNIGILIKPENVYELERAILDSNNENLQFISNNARKYSIENLSRDRIISDYMEYI